MLVQYLVSDLSSNVADSLGRSTVQSTNAKHSQLFPHNLLLHLAEEHRHNLNNKNIIMMYNWSIVGPLIKDPPR